MKHILLTLLFLSSTAFGQSIKKNADGSAQVFFKDGSSSNVQTMSSGTYTPVISACVQCTTSATHLGTFTVQGKVLTVSGGLVVDPTANLWQFNIDVPVGLTLGTVGSSCGGSAGSGSPAVCQIAGPAGTQTVQATCYDTNATANPPNQDIRFIFSCPLK